jgi:hypothetical protein
MSSLWNRVNHPTENYWLNWRPACEKSLENKEREPIDIGCSSKEELTGKPKRIFLMVILC